MHTEIGMTPLRKWEIGIHGNAEVDGIGFPEKASDRQRLQLDFLPAFSRTVQSYGVAIEGLRYQSETLYRWVGELLDERGSTGDSSSKKRPKRKLTFRRDPRDVSGVYMFTA